MAKFAIILVLLLAACSPRKDERDLDQSDMIKATRVLRVSGFERIRMLGVDNVRIRLGSTFSVRVEGPRYILNQTVVAREGDIPGIVDAAKAELSSDGAIASLNKVLRITRNFKSASEWMTPSPVRATVFITMPQIESVDMASSGDMTIEGLRGRRFAAGVGNGRLILPDVHVDNLAISIGDADIVVDGETDLLELWLHGSHRHDFRRLAVGRAVVNKQGSDSLIADVRGPVTLSAEGSGSIDLGRHARCTLVKRESTRIRCGGLEPR